MKNRIEKINEILSKFLMKEEVQEVVNSITSKGTDALKKLDDLFYRLNMNEWNDDNALYIDAEAVMMDNLLELQPDLLNYCYYIPPFIFYNCELNEITIPGNVKTIGDHAFASCENLKKVVVKDGVENIEERAFSDCNNLSEVELPDSLVKIGEDIFVFCSELTNLTLPASLEELGDNTFMSSGIRQLNYKGTKQDFLKIRKNKAWNHGSIIFSIKCIDGVLRLDSDEYLNSLK